VTRTLAAELLHRHHFPIHTVRRLCTNLKGFRNTLVLTFDNVGPNGRDCRGALVCEHLDDLNASVGRWMDSNNEAMLHVPRLEDSLHALEDSEGPIQMMVCGPVERMREAEALLTQDSRVVAVGQPERDDTEVTLHRTIYPDKDLAIVDILPAGCSKASALQRLLDKQGLSAAELMAIGDNWNDVAMLRLAGHPVLMGNAPADLLELAAHEGWQLAPGNDEDGVAAVIENTLARQSQPQ
jgi:hypothetical protein